MMTTLDELKAKLLANPEVKAAYDALKPEYAIARELITAKHAPHQDRLQPSPAA